MKNFTANFRRAVLLVAFAACVVTLAGCASTEPSNVSQRPWNSPKGWETGGLPGMMFDRR
ncbi:MAG: hypothetical protein HY300_03635 [Verrucomicrobia bacterium]|nr:hypothetical protein [Verrucomicrobiota bacterium]